MEEDAFELESELMEAGNIYEEYIDQELEEELERDLLKQDSYTPQSYQSHQDQLYSLPKVQDEVSNKSQNMINNNNYSIASLIQHTPSPRYQTEVPYTNLYKRHQQFQIPQYQNEDDIEQYSSDPYYIEASPPTPTPRHSRRNAPTSKIQNRMIHTEYVNQSFQGLPTKPVINTTSGEHHGVDPRNKHGIRLRPVSELPDKYASIFKFGVFNAMQSKCFDTLMKTKDNMVVSAPTGGGKTVLFELALIEMLSSNIRSSSISKCVYVSPTKALCAERSRDWCSKFEPLGVKCCEMTGDTVQMGKSAWNVVKESNVIVTTSEKWDSLTRSWHDYDDFLSNIKLFLVDEVHVLNESRGSTLEVVISRMKRRNETRFILVSATVPNIRDIAAWVGNPGSHLSATVFEFGEDFRPCRISRHVVGVPRKNQNDFQFSRTLDFKLYEVIQQYSSGKPILIFCSTRKGVVTTAEQLLKDYEQSVATRQTTPWSPPKQTNHHFHDKKLEKLANCGIGVHHAGLSLDDRKTTEELFLGGLLRVICATSTLAVGVNLPAHTVIIKGVKLYVANAWQEYTDLDIIQMIGRAGRPQFDREGVAIILCESELEHKYKNLAQGKTVLESSLHENLLEHINSEIGIGTIRDRQSAKDWLRNSFLRQRIEKNPGHYHMGKSAVQTWEEKMDDLVTNAIKKLEENELIESAGERDTDLLKVTDYGEIMSKYYIRQSTMGNLLKLPDKPSVRDILECISSAEELSDVRLRSGDKQVYNKMCDNPDIRFKIKRVEKAADKAFLLIQAILGGVSLSTSEYKTADSQPALDALSVFRHTARIARVVVELAIIKKNGAQLKHGLELVRCLTAKAWEDRPVVLKQIESIGEKSLKVLAERGITSLSLLRKQEPARIEMLLNRKPPFGHDVLAFLHELPQYHLAVKVAKNGIVSYSGAKPISLELEIEAGLLSALQTSKWESRQKTKHTGYTSILTTTSDLDFIDFRRIPTRVLGKGNKTFTVSAELTKPSQSICILITSETHAGLTVTRDFKPSISAKEFPTMDTHPKNADAMMLEEFQDNPDMWDEFLAIDKNELQSDEGPNLRTNSRDEKSDEEIDELEEDTHPTIRRLPNGRFACNHTCKDKSKCRHFCCREGLVKPAPLPKNQQSTKKAQRTSPVKKTTSSASRKRSDQGMESKVDKNLAQMEALHKATGVYKALRIDEGKRIKLDNCRNVDAYKPKLGRQPKSKVLDLDFEFADIRDEENKKEPSDEHMPDINELLSSHKQGTEKPRTSSSEYSTDPDLDAIIAGVDDISALYAQTTQTTLTDFSFSQPSYKAESNSIENVNKKRNIPDNSQPSPSTKRTKIFHDLQKPSDDKLFLPGSSQSVILNLAPSNDDFTITTAKESDSHIDDNFFDLDATLFNIFPASSSSPALCQANLHALDKTVAIAESDGTSTIEDKQATPSEGDKGDLGQTEEGDCGYEYDEWADMENWLLNSGLVKLVGPS